MAIFISAGHHISDPGAAGNNYIERDLAIELRNLVEANLKTAKALYIVDKDTETLSQYLSRIQPGNGSVVVEIHWNAALSTTVSGTEVFIADNHNKISKDLATDLASGLASIMGIKNRGVRTESQSGRKRLAFVREGGANCLIEIAFISNKDDMRRYQEKKCEIAKFISDTLIKYDAKI